MEIKNIMDKKVIKYSDDFKEISIDDMQNIIKNLTEYIEAVLIGTNSISIVENNEYIIKIKYFNDIEHDFSTYIAFDFYNNKVVNNFISHDLFYLDGIDEELITDYVDDEDGKVDITKMTTEYLFYLYISDTIFELNDYIKSMAQHIEEASDAFELKIQNIEEKKQWINLILH